LKARGPGQRKSISSSTGAARWFGGIRHGFLAGYNPGYGFSAVGTIRKVGLDRYTRAWRNAPFYVSDDILNAEVSGLFLVTAFARATYSWQCEDSGCVIVACEILSQMWQCIQNYSKWRRQPEVTGKSSLPRRHSRIMNGGSCCARPRSMVLRLQTTQQFNKVKDRNFISRICNHVLEAFIDG